MRRRNSASSSSGTFTRNGRIPVLSAGSSVKTAAVGAVEVTDMSISFLEEDWGSLHRASGSGQTFEMRPVDGLRDAAELDIPFLMARESISSMPCRFASTV